MPNPYTGTDNDPISAAQHQFLGKDWEKYFAMLNQATGGRLPRMGAQGPGAPVSLAGPGRTNGVFANGEQIGDAESARSNAINAYLSDLTDQNKLKHQADLDMAARNRAVDNSERERQVGDRAMAIANDPRTSAFGAPIVPGSVRGQAGLVTGAPVGQPPPNRQAIAAQMAPGVIAPPAPAPPVTFGAPVKAAVNGKATFVRPGSDGQVYDMNRKPIPPEAIAQEGATAATPTPLDANGQPVTGDALLQTFPAAKQKVLTAIIEGRQALPSGTALKDPYWKDLLESANLVDPSFDTVNYNARNKAYTDLSSPSGTGGKSINALNTAAQHISKLSELVEKLDNFDTPMLNRVRNPIASEFGSTKVTNFEAVQPQAMKEIERLWRGAGGSAGEIDKLKDSLGPNMGKQQQREALAEFADLMLGKLDATRSQRDSALGPIASKRVPVLFDQNKASLAKIFERAGKAAPEVLGGGAHDAPPIDPQFSTPAEGSQKGIPGIPGGLAKFTGGKWIRVQ